MVKLTVISGDQKGETYVLPKEQITLGRDSSNEIQVSGQKISRTHAMLEPVDDDWVLTDLGSSNGTFVNGDQVKTSRLHSGDEVRLGEIKFLFLDEEQTPAEEKEGGPEDRQEILAETFIGGESEILRRPGQARDLSEIQRLNEKLRSLIDLTRHVGSARALPEFVEGVQKAVEACLEPDRIVPILVGQDGSLAPYQAEGTDFGQDLSQFPISRSIVDHAREKKVGVLSHNAGQDDRFRGARSIALNQIATAICVPILRDDRLLGLLYVDRLGEAESFTKEDLETLGAIGLCLAAPMENVSAYQAVTQEKNQLQKELQLHYHLIGESKPMQAVFDFVKKVGPSEACVLITGASGTGKELVARAIHYGSQRAGQALEVVNCAALNHSLMDSELFGHARGAFTDAREERPGRFELADKGTLFLDEIGELSEECQSKLLRVLEHGDLRRLGDTGDRHVDIRIIAATNRDLQQEIESGRFREDLFYRLNVLRIHLPPLQERPGDIHILAQHFLQEFANRCARPSLQFTDEALQALLAYTWPGNVRELKNVIERMVVLSSGEEITVEDLPGEFQAEPVKGAAPANGPVTSLAEVEKQHIIRVLQKTGGNKKEAARILGIDRSTLYARLKTYQIEV